MKNLYKILENKFLVKKNIQADKQTFQVIKEVKPYFSGGELYYYLIYHTQEDFDKLIEGKGFWDGRGELKEIRKRAGDILKYNKGYLPTIRITWGSKNGTLSDGSIEEDRIDNKEYYEKIAQTSANDFNLEYWKKHDWVFW